MISRIAISKSYLLYSSEKALPAKRRSNSLLEPHLYPETTYYNDTCRIGKHVVSCHKHIVSESTKHTQTFRIGNRIQQECRNNML